MPELPALPEYNCTPSAPLIRKRPPFSCTHGRWPTMCCVTHPRSDSIVMAPSPFVSHSPLDVMLTLPEGPVAPMYMSAVRLDTISRVGALLPVAPSRLRPLLLVQWSRCKHSSQLHSSAALPDAQCQCHQEYRAPGYDAHRAITFESSDTESIQMLARESLLMEIMPVPRVSTITYQLIRNTRGEHAQIGQEQSYVHRWRV